MIKQAMDNNSYNIIQALASTLEALEAYRTYQKDGNAQLWEQVAQHTEQIVQLLQQQLPQVVQQSQSNFATQSQSSQPTGIS